MGKYKGRLVLTVGLWLIIFINETSNIYKLWYIYIYICVCVSIYAYIYTWVYTRIHTCTAIIWPLRSLICSWLPDFESKRLTTEVWPFWAARCSGITPYSGVQELSLHLITNSIMFMSITKLVNSRTIII